MKYFYSSLLLITLHGLIDFLFAYIYPEVNPIRASLIAITALAILTIFYFITRKRLYVHPLIGGLSIFSSAISGALLVQAQVLISKSLISALAHVLILLVTYLLLEWIRRRGVLKTIFEFLEELV